MPSCLNSHHTKTPTLQKQRGCSISHIRGSARTLVVGDALRLGGTGALGGERQHDERDDIRHHVVHRTGNVHRREEAKAHVDIRKRAEQAEEERRERDALGLPLTEDHDREGQEAEACHAVLKAPFGNAGGDEHDAADAAKE